MKKVSFFQYTEEDWFPPDVEGSELYINYISAMQGGIVRLTNQMPVNYHGICTGRLQMCLGLVIANEQGNASIIHITPKCNKQAIVEEVKWLGKISLSVIAYNPKAYSGSKFAKLKEIVDALNQLLLSNNLQEIFPKYEEAQYGSIAYNRKSKEVILPKRSHVGSSEWKIMRYNVGIINDFFEGQSRLRLEFNGENFEDVINLSAIAEKYFKDSKDILKTNTPENRTLFRSKLLRDVFNPDKKDCYLFGRLSVLWAEGKKEIFTKILNDVTQAFFDYFKGYKIMKEEIAKYSENFFADFDLQKIIDDANRKVGWVQVPSSSNSRGPR